MRACSKQSVDCLPRAHDLPLHWTALGKTRFQLVDEGAPGHLTQVNEPRTYPCTLGPSARQPSERARRRTLSMSGMSRKTCRLAFAQWSRLRRIVPWRVGEPEGV